MVENQQRIYIETSVVSYLTARPSMNVQACAWQSVTTDWWERQRNKFSLFTSQLVVEEASRGNEEAARRRLEVLQQIPHVAISNEVVLLAQTLISDGALPQVASDDALHVALAAVHNLDYLLTWNCRHIHNAQKQPLIRQVCSNKGYRYPEICTPLELSGEDDHDR
ncbi:MAG: type II toxin-antitoxin system VapC family toxin [Deltaproteobacteria bacterium]|nr:type II toxin-antitoxin system VapC family toxin [Deltaproteobacteria bacterium]